MGKKKGFERGWRPDKVLTPKGFEKWFSSKDIRTVGKFPLQSFVQQEQLQAGDLEHKEEDDSVIRTPSDHYAILCVFNILNPID